MKVLGIDIGATHVRYGLLENNLLVRKVSAKSHVDSPESLAEQCKGIVSEFPEVRNVGIALPGPLDREGTLYHPPNFPHWGEVNFQRTLEKVLNTPFVLVRDSIAALYGEWKTGLAKDRKNVVLLTLGTGIGGAAVVEGQILRGVHGFSGEFGHLLVGPTGRQCGLGHEGCAEAWASGRSLETGVTLDQATDILARLLKSVELTFDPELIVLSGGLVENGEYIDQAHKKASAIGLQTEVKKAEFGEWSGVVGAAILAEEGESKRGKE